MSAKPSRFQNPRVVTLFIDIADPIVTFQKVQLYAQLYTVVMFSKIKIITVTLN